MTQYIISKRGLGRPAQASDAYRGPTCQRAGVPAGKVYAGLKEALRDYQLLCWYNGVFVDMGGVYAIGSSIQAAYDAVNAEA